MDKEAAAIDRIRFLSDTALAAYGQPLVVAYSGGKDNEKKSIMERKGHGAHKTGLT